MVKHGKQIEKYYVRTDINKEIEEISMTMSKIHENHEYFILLQDGEHIAIDLAEID